MAVRSDTLQIRYEVTGDGRVKASMGETASGMDRIATGASRAGAAIGAILAAGVTAVAVGVRRAINEMDELAKASQRVGVGVEPLSALKHAADLSGVSFGSLTNSLNIFNRTLSDNEGLMRQLGVEVRDANGQLRPTEEIIRGLSDVFASFEDGPEKAELAMKLFGRSGAELIPLLNSGSEEIERMEEQARRLGLVIDAEAAAAAERFNDDLTILGGVMTGVRNEVAQQLLPNLTALTGQLVDSAESGNILKDTATGIATVLRVVAATFATVATSARVAGITAGAAIDAIGGSLENLKLLADPRSGGVLGVVFNSEQRAQFQANADRGVQAISVARQMIEEEQQALSRTFESIFTQADQATSAVPAATGTAAEAAAQRAAAIREEIRRLLENGNGQGTQGATERDLYGPAIANLERQLALLGDNSNAARVLYDIQSGALGVLLPEQEALLAARARELDQAQQRAEMEREAQQFLERTRTEAEAYAAVLLRVDELYAMGLVTLEERNRIEAAYQPRDRAQDMIADLQFELELMGMSNAERRTAIQLRQLEGEATAAQVEDIRRLNEQIERTTSQQQAWRQLGQVGGRALADLATGARTTDDTLRNLAATLIEMLAQRLFEQLAQSAAGGGGGGGFGAGGGGGWGALFTGIAGAFAGRAAGGMTSAGQRILVGENGPEWRYERTPGLYVPNHQMDGDGGGSATINVTQNMMFQGRPDTRTMAQAANRTRENLEISWARSS